MSDEDNSLHEKPGEFLSNVANSGGRCDGQIIMPSDDHYTCYCTCGDWRIETHSAEEGLYQARVHTGSISASV